MGCWCKKKVRHLTDIIKKTPEEEATKGAVQDFGDASNRKGDDRGGNNRDNDDGSANNIDNDDDDDDNDNDDDDGKKEISNNSSRISPPQNYSRASSNATTCDVSMHSAKSTTQNNHTLYSPTTHSTTLQGATQNNHTVISNLKNSVANANDDDKASLEQTNSDLQNKTSNLNDLSSSNNSNHISYQNITCANGLHSTPNNSSVDASDSTIIPTAPEQRAPLTNQNLTNPNHKGEQTKELITEDSTDHQDSNNSIPIINGQNIAFTKNSGHQLCQTSEHSSEKYGSKSNKSSTTIIINVNSSDAPNTSPKDPPTYEEAMNEAAMNGETPYYIPTANSCVENEGNNNIEPLASAPPYQYEQDPEEIPTKEVFNQPNLPNLDNPNDSSSNQDLNLYSTKNSITPPKINTNKTNNQLYPEVPDSNND